MCYKTNIKNIQKDLDHFILYNSYCEQKKKSRNWIDGDKSKGGYGHIRVTVFFYSINTSWIKRYATQIIDDHCWDLLDMKLRLTRKTMKKLYKWGTEKYNPIINEKLHCISEFVSCYQMANNFLQQTQIQMKTDGLNIPFSTIQKIRWGIGKKN